MPSSPVSYASIRRFWRFLAPLPRFFFDQAPRLRAGRCVARAEPRLGGPSLTVREQSVQHPTGRESLRFTGLGQPLVIVLEVRIPHLLDRLLKGVGRSSIAAVTGPQAASRMSRSFWPTLQSQSMSATHWAPQSPQFGHRPQAPSRISRSFWPTTPSPSRSADRHGLPGAARLDNALLRSEPAVRAPGL